MRIANAIMTFGLLLACSPRAGAQTPGAPAAVFRKVVGVESVERSGQGVMLKAKLDDGRDLSIRIDVLSGFMVRIRAAAEGRFVPTLQERDGFIRQSWPPTEFTLTDAAGQFRIQVQGLSVRVRKQPFELALYYNDRLLAATVAAGVGFSHDMALFSVASPAEERFFGFGYNGARTTLPFSPDRSPYDHRGHYVLAAGLSSERVYYFPFFASSRGYGLFYNTLTLTEWDMARTRQDRYTIRANENRLDVYLIAGPLFRDILQRYTEIVGRSPLPPKWEFGEEVRPNLQGVAVNGRIPYLGWNTRWYEQKSLEALARDTRAKHLPGDYFHLDSGWQTIRNSFDWVTQVSDPKEMISLLNKLNFKVGLWQRPTLLVEDYPLFREAEEQGYLVKGPDGKAFSNPLGTGEVKALVDFTNPRAVEWWQKRVAALVALGVRAFKLDSESSGYNESFPEAFPLRFHNGMSGRDLENYYAPLYIKIVWDALREGLHGRRASLHIYHQAYFAANRYPWFGLGDRTQRTLPAVQIRDALNLSFCAVPYWVGGPVNSFGLPDATPAQRLQLMPYLYTYWHENAETGMPVIRPLALEYQDDPESLRADTEYLLGRDLLVAPSLQEIPLSLLRRGGDEDAPARMAAQLAAARQTLGTVWRDVSLPPGEWVNFASKEKYIGPGKQSFQSRNGQAIVLARGGAIIPMGPAMEWVGQKPEDPITLEIYPAGASSFTMYEDDGDTYAYQAGAFATTRFTSREREDGVDLAVEPVKGGYSGMLPERRYVLRVFGTVRPKAVLAGGHELAGFATEQELRRGDAGWSYTNQRDYNRTLTIALPAVKAAEGIKVRLEGAVPIRYYF